MGPARTLSRGVFGWRLGSLEVWRLGCLEEPQRLRPGLSPPATVRPKVAEGKAQLAWGETADFTDLEQIKGRLPPAGLPVWKTAKTQGEARTASGSIGRSAASPLTAPAALRFAPCRFLRNTTRRPAGAFCSPFSVLRSPGRQRRPIPLSCGGWGNVVYCGHSFARL